MGQNGQILATKSLFGHFLEIAWLVFANFAYDDRQAYLTGDSGWKIFPPSNLVISRNDGVIMRKNRP